MLKPLAISVALLAGSVGSASAISAPPKVEWRGSVYLLTVSGCGTSGYSANQILRMRYSPDNLGNDGKSRLSFFNDYFAQSFVATGSFVSGTPVAANGGHTGGGTSSMTSSPKVQITSLTSPLTATTKAIAIEGKVTGFYDTAACTITFRGAGSLRP